MQPNLIVNIDTTTLDYVAKYRLWERELRSGQGV